MVASASLPNEALFLLKQVISATGGKARWLDIPGDPRNHYIPHAEWLPDGKRLLVQQFNRLQNTNRVMLADAKSGAIRIVPVDDERADARR